MCIPKKFHVVYLKLVPISGPKSIIAGHSARRHIVAKTILCQEKLLQDIIMYEPESDPPSWALNIFDVDQILKYYGDSNQNDVKISHEQYANDNHYDTFPSDVDNDETITRSLEEEFPKLSVTEEPDTLHIESGYLPDSTTFINDFPAANSYSGIFASPSLLMGPFLCHSPRLVCCSHLDFISCKIFKLFRI